jgi:hypothetical protein
MKPNYLFQKEFKQALKLVSDAHKAYNDYFLSWNGKTFKMPEPQRLEKLEKDKNARDVEYKTIAEKFYGQKIGIYKPLPSLW